MPDRCIICHNYNDDFGKGFFILPKNIPKRKRWIFSAKLEDFYQNNGGRVCFRHFKDTDFNTNLKRLSLRPGMKSVQKCICTEF